MKERLFISLCVLVCNVMFSGLSFAASSNEESAEIEVVEDTPNFKRILFTASRFERENEDGEYIYPEDVPATFEFIGDTLHVTGVVYLPCYSCEATCTIDKYRVYVRVVIPVEEPGEETDCWTGRKVDLKFPGFAAGTYKVSCSWKDVAAQSVVCEAKTTGISSCIDAEKTPTDFVDLQGRRQLQPTTHGIYIKGGKKMAK